MSLNKQVIAGVTWTTIGTFSVTAANVLKISILARFLTKDEFGLFAIVAFFIGFFNLFSDMGLTSAILHKKDIKKTEYASLYWFNIFFCIVLFALLLVITPFVAEFYNQPRLVFLINTLALTLVINSIGLQFKTIEIKNLSFKHISIIDIFSSFISLVFAILLAINDYGILSLVYSMVLQYAISNLCLFILGLRKYGIKIHFRKKELYPFLRIGFFQVGSQSINFFNKDLDILIIAKFFTADILGGYSLAKQLVFRPAQVINPIITKVSSPVLARFQDNLELLKINFLKLINIVSSINLIAYSILIVFTPIIVQVFYGSGYDDIVIIVRILVFYAFIRAVGNPIASLVIATGRTDIEFIWNVGVFFILPLFVYFGCLLGIVEVAYLVTLSGIILFLPGWYFLVHKMSKASLKEYLNSILNINFNFLRKDNMNNQ